MGNIKDGKGTARPPHDRRIELATWDPGRPVGSGGGDPLLKSSFHVKDSDLFLLPVFSLFLFFFLLITFDC